MNFLKRVIVIIYAALMLAVGAILILVCLSVVAPGRWVDIFKIIAEFPALQITFGAVGGLFILLGISAPYRLEKNLRKNRIIAFQNPDGEVTVSLSAVEDYIRKIARNIFGIKDVSSRVSIGKKGIDIKISAAVSSSANIPEVTENLQMEIKSKVQNMLGVEEKINVQLHIKNIARVAGEPAENISAEERIPYR